MRTTLIAALGSVLMAAPGPAAWVKAAPTYSVKMQIYDGGELIGTPQLTVQEGQSGTTEANLPKGKGYSVAAIVTRETGNMVTIKAKVELLSPQARRSMTPQIWLRLGDTASVENSSHGAPFRVIFEVASEQTATPKH